MKSLLLALFSLILVTVFSSVSKGIEDKSLVLYFPFEEGKGEKTNDLSGNGNDGTIKGAEWTKEGKIGNAISFNGKDAYIEVKDSQILRITDEITVEVWFFAKSYPTTYPRMVQKGIGTSFEFDLKNTGSVDWEANIGGWHECNSGAGSITLSKWYHTAGVFDGKAMRVYVNGIEKVSCPFSGKLGTDNTVLQIGGYTPQGANPFDGILDEVAIYNRALKEEEIKQDMEKGVVKAAVKSIGKLATIWGRVKGW